MNRGVTVALWIIGFPLRLAFIPLWLILVLLYPFDAKEISLECLERFFGVKEIRNLP
jgi:hypothetical protein